MLSQNVIDLAAIAAAGGLMIFALMKWCELCVWLAIRDELTSEVANASDSQQVSEPKALVDRPIGKVAKPLVEGDSHQSSRTAFPSILT